MNSRLMLVCLLGVVWASSGCGGINERSKADVDRQLGAITASSETYPTPEQAGHLPLAVGQWARYKVVDNDGRPSITLNKIVGKSGDAWVVETVTESYYGRVVNQITMTIDDAMKPVDILKVVQKMDDQEPTEIGEMQRKLAGDTIKKGLVAFSVDLAAAGEPETVAVTAGTFEGVRQGETTVTFGPWSKTSQVWVHPAVPFSGVVKTTGELGDSELIAFGTSGAESELGVP